MSTDDLEQRVQEIIQKLDTLQLSQEYGQVLEDLYGKMQAMEGEIATLKLVPQPSKEFKPGRLGVRLEREGWPDSKFNGLGVAVTNGEQTYYGTTAYRFGTLFFGDIPVNAYCDLKELPGGKYTVEVKCGISNYSLNITVDNDTLVTMALTSSNEREVEKNNSSVISAEKVPESISQKPPKPVSPAEKTPVGTSLTLFPEKPVNYHSNPPRSLYFTHRNALFAVLLTMALAGAVIGVLAMKYRLQNTITETGYLAPEQTNP